MAPPQIGCCRAGRMDAHGLPGQNSNQPRRWANGRRHFDSLSIIFLFHRCMQNAMRQFSIDVFRSIQAREAVGCVCAMRKRDMANEINSHHTRAPISVGGGKNSLEILQCLSPTVPYESPSSVGPRVSPVCAWARPSHSEQPRYGHSRYLYDMRKLKAEPQK